MNGKATYVPLPKVEYDRTLKTFHEATGQHKNMAALLGPIVREFEGRPIKFLSIGAGDGLFEDLMVKEKGMKLDYFYGMEPDEIRRKELQQRVLSWNVDNIIDGSCFTESFETDKKFDLILMAHVLYFMANPVESIKKAMSFLKSQGKLVIIHDDRGSVTEVHSRFLQLLDSHFKTEELHALTLSKLSEDMNSVGINHELIKETVRLDITEFIDKQNTPKMIDLVSFMVQTEFDKLASDIQDQIYRFVKDRCVQDDNRHFYPNPFGMIVVTKTL